MKDISWEEIFDKANFGDIRRNARAIEILHNLDNTFEKSASASFANSAEYKGATRFVNIDTVTPESILEPFISYNLKNLKADHVLIIQDTTEFNYSWRKKNILKNLGPVGNNKDQGFFFHPGLIVNPENECVLGLGASNFWIRDYEEQSKGKKKNQTKPFKERESYRWLSLAEDVQREIDDSIQFTVVGDRESDIFDIFDAKENGILSENCEILVRSARDRKLKDSNNSLYTEIEDWKIKGEYNLKVNSTPQRTKREAKIEVKYGPFSLMPSKTKWHTGKKPIDNIFVIDAKEKNPPANEPAIHWILLTTWPITTLESAIEKINWYSARWYIEELFRLLKSGYKVEKVKFDDGKALMNWCALRLMQAIRLFHLLTQRDVKIPNSALPFFNETEINILEYIEKNNISKKSEIEVPPKFSLGWAVLLLAVFGGYKASPSAKPPGQESLWRGMIKLDAAQIGFMAASGKSG